MSAVPLRTLATRENLKDSPRLLRAAVIHYIAPATRDVLVLYCHRNRPGTVLYVSLEISTHEASGVTILHLRGRATIGGGESELFNNHLKRLIAAGARKLLLNLKELTHVDSSGVGIIVGTCVSLRRQGGDLKLLCPHERVLKVLTVFHLLNVIECFDDEAQALASFRPNDYSVTP